MCDVRRADSHLRRPSRISSLAPREWEPALKSKVSRSFAFARKRLWASSGLMPGTESVTTAASTSGGAVNRPLTSILNILSGRVRVLIRAWPAFGKSLEPLRRGFPHVRQRVHSDRPSGRTTSPSMHENAKQVQGPPLELRSPTIILTSVAMKGIVEVSREASPRSSVN